MGLFAQEQVPQAFTYQAIARDADGAPITNTAVKVRIAILEDDASGSAIYLEEFETATNKFGLFVLQIGTGSTSDDFQEINWAARPHFIQTEFDSGSGFNLLGSAQVLSVPYALVAERAILDETEDADADPANELQTISLDGNTVTLSDGGSFDLPQNPGDTDDQELTFDSNTNELTIDDGNTVDLSPLQDGVNDADADPQNELQTIDLTGTIVTLSNGGGSFNLPTGTTDTDDQELDFNPNTNELTIDDGNTVDLSPLQDGVEDADADPQNELQGLVLNGNVLSIVQNGGMSDVTLPNGSSLWQEDGADIFYEGGSVQVRNAANQNLIQMDGGTTNDSGQLNLYGDGNSKIFLWAGLPIPGNDFGRITLNGENGSSNVRLSALTSDQGSFGLYDEENSPKVTAYSTEDAGEVLTRGDNGIVNCWMVHLGDFPNNGYIAVLDEDGLDADNLPEAGMLVDENGNGSILISGTNSFGGDESASVYIDPDFGGTIEGDIKNFVMPHPQDDTKEIIYACIEGPEAAAYERGTTTLENGEAFIPFSDHFKLVINPETITVNLTPNSANTLGLAVIEKTAEGIRVKELMNGTGNFSFDWEVKAVRAGFETFKPIREKRELPKVANPITNSKN